MMFAALALAWASTARAQEFDTKGELGVESRLFSSDDRGVTEDRALAAIGRCEASYHDGAWSARVRVFGRADAYDGSRDLLVPEEAWLEYRQPRWHARVGVELDNGSVLEIFHPADVFNSRNFDGEIENLEKLGEPAVSLGTVLGPVTVTAFYLPWRIEPHLPGPHSRLSGLPDGVGLGDAVWVSRNGRIDSGSRADQFALRAETRVGPADLTFHYLHHQDRLQPLFAFDSETLKVKPVFLPVDQLGATVQAAVASWVLKLELTHRDFTEPSPRETSLAGLRQPDHTTLAAGVEYGWSTPGGGQTSLVLEVETIFGTTAAERRALAVFQRDVGVAVRYAFNDVADRQVTASAIFDLERSGEYLVSLTYRQRLAEVLSLRAGVRVIEAAVGGDDPVGLERFRNVDYLFASLVYNF
ncbi:MAG: hypothetical protein U0002_16485 [Thermoanaerobaculia bacterium]